MKATPGGILPINEIFGREEFIRLLWDTLDRNSVRIEAERRIGKTNTLKKMLAEPREGWVAIYLDLESVHSASEFSEVVCKQIYEKLTFWNRQGKRIKDFLHSCGGAEVGGLKFPEKRDQSASYWKNLLNCTIEDLVEQQALVGKRVVFFFDEMPWMLSAIAAPNRDGPDTAMEVLDILRAIRQSPKTGPGFRMIICGSIGLHHILGELSSAGHRNQSVNDMELKEVPPLSNEMAEKLSIELLNGEGIVFETEVPKYIVDRTGGFAYYIHWVVNELKTHGQTGTIVNVQGVIQHLLTASHDPCSFRHFLTRIDDYYPEDKDYVLAILDHAACAAEPLSIQDLINIARSVGAKDSNRVRELIRLITVDHYLRRGQDNCYSFQHTLLCQWWVLERGLV